MRRPRLLFVGLVAVMALAIAVPVTLWLLDDDGLSGSWRVTALEADGVTFDPAASPRPMTLRASGMRVAGEGPCNTFEGAITDADTVLGDLTSTDRGCAGPISDLESAYYLALERATSYDEDGGTLVLTGTDLRVELASD